MPVYNAEKYLAKAINSVLQQTFRDFELIIINDGSTDSSLDIIKNYKDPRIKLFSRENKGLVYTLNEGLGIAKGKYIARMDADDISMSNRLRKQYDYLESHPKIGLVTSVVDLIGENDEELSLVWAEDREAITEDKIRENMPKSNCIAHPAIMVRAKLIKKYKYHNQKNGEDYDLWLRMLSSGVIIHKINQPLLKYRLHSKSLTQTSNEGGGYSKIIAIKKNFLKNQIKNKMWGKIEKEVVKSIKSDYINYYYGHSGKVYIKYPLKIFRRIIKVIKRIINNIKAALIKLEDIELSSDKKNILFLIPWMTVGGADKVYLDIISNANKKKFNFFFINLELGEKNTWMHRFEQHSKNITVLPGLIDNGSYRQYLKRYLKKYLISTVVTSNTLKGYKLLKTVKEAPNNIKTIDILHGQSGKNDGGGSPAFSDKYSGYIDLRVTVTNYLNKYMQKTYGVDRKKIMTIHNGVDINYFNPKNIRKGIIKNQYNINSSRVISWIGRFSPEKQPLAFIELAKIISKEVKYKNVSFVMAGDGILKEEVLSAIEEYGLKDRIVLPGFISNTTELYQDSNIVVMTSEMEGLPIVLLEAGSMEVPVVATKVGGIPEIIKNGVNGFMVNNNLKMPIKMAEKVKVILDNKSLERRMGKNSRDIILNNFSLVSMTEKYEKII